MNSLLIPQLKYPLGVLPNQRAKYLEDKEKILSNVLRISMMNHNTLVNYII
jgi:hypothetical protein